MYIQRAQEETGEGDEGESGENFTFALGIAGQVVSIYNTMIFFLLLFYFRNIFFDLSFYLSSLSFTPCQ